MARMDNIEFWIILAVLCYVAVKAHEIAAYMKRLTGEGSRSQTRLSPAAKKDSL